MGIDTRLPGSGDSDPPSFGTATLRLLPPQALFELLRAYVASTTRRTAAGDAASTPPSPPGAATDAKGSRQAA